VQALANQKVQSVSGGLWHTLASVRDGGVYGWGLADRGRIGVASGEQLVPRRIPDVHVMRGKDSF
jgi:alpha-tubulin suppressor-like RCC1 family protein